MKPRTFLSLLAACILTFATTAVAAETPAPAGDINLYLSQDTAKPALMQLKANDSSIATAVPVMDATKAAEGWHTLVLPGPVAGYVASKFTHKDMTVTAGTAIHSAPDENSPVLGPSPASPLLNVKSPGIDWSEVSFPGPVIAYFQAVNKPAAPATVTAPTTPAPTPAPVRPVVNEPPTRPAGSMVPATTSTVTAMPAIKKADASDVGHYYYGVLKQRTDTKIGGPANIRYVLYSDKDQVLALVDLNDVVLPNPLVAYLNKSVRIYGTVYPESSLPFAVIHAVTLQAN